MISSVLPGDSEHPDSTCIHCSQSVHWARLLDGQLAYVGNDGGEACPGTSYEHEPIRGVNNGWEYGQS